MYKKRRKAKTINKNKEKHLRSQSSYPDLKSQYPQIKNLRLDIQFLSQEGHVLEETQTTYGPGDQLQLSIDCPGGCGDGKISLESKIDSAVRQRNSTDEGRSQCVEPLYSDTKICGAQLKCGINIEYFPGAPEEE